MWFATATKLDDAIKLLMVRMGEVHLGMEEVIRDSSGFDGTLGPCLEYNQFQAGGEKITGGLLNLLTGLRSERATVAQVSARLPNATAMVQRHEELFGGMIAARLAGAAAADKFFDAKR